MGVMAPLFYGGNEEATQEEVASLMARIYPVCSKPHNDHGLHKGIDHFATIHCPIALK